MSDTPFNPAIGDHHHAADTQAAILNALPANIALLDPNGVISAVNDGWRCFAVTNELQGPDYAVGQNYLDVCGSADGECAVDAHAAAAGIRQVLRGEAMDFAIEYPCHSPSKERWFLLTVTPIRQDEQTGAVVMHVDITDRKEAEIALRERNETFDLLTSNIADAFWIRSPDMRELRYVSPAFERIWGRSEASVYANPGQWIDFVVPEDRERVRTIFLSLTQDAAIVDLEYRIQRLDGEVRWVRARGFQVRNAAGTLTSLTGIVTDITEGHLVAEALRTRTEEFLLLAQAMPQIVWLARPDGSSVYMNQQWVDYTGLTPAEGLGHGWNTPFHPDDRARAWQAWQDAAAVAAPFSYECRMRRADGMYRWWLIRGVPMQGAFGVVVKWCGTCTDIHDLKLAELEISRTNRALQAEIVERTRAEDAAEAANRAKSEFLANMSHEIRTPLNGVVGITELVLDTHLSAEQREYLQMVKTSGESLLTVVNDILDFSKIEAGQLAFDVIPFDLADCLATTIKPLAARAHLKGLELACQIRPDVPTALVGDPSRLAQIITNLMGNAIKFTERGEAMLTVEVDTRTDRNAVLQFSVSDTGIGVPQAQQDAIFRPFIQADGSTTRKYGGTGLGLAISSNLVAMRGGRIWLESESGKGSTFHFTVSFDLQQTPEMISGAPLLTPDVPARSGPAPAVRTRSALRILLAEDNKVNQFVAARLLGKRGHTVVIAANGREALAALDAADSAPFDVILMDIQMPDMDGFETTRIIRERETSGGVHIPIVAMTAHAMKGDEERCLAAGMDGYVSKPIEFEQLFATMDRVLA